MVSKSSGVGHGCHPCPVFVDPPQDHEETMTLAETEDTTPSFIYQEANYQPGRSWRTWLIGRPLSTADAPHQTIGKFDRVGCLRLRRAVVDGLRHPGNDAGPGCRGHAGLRPTLFPISLAIVVLLAILTISYEQTIHAYPGGGGAYIVARDNLGEAARADSRRGAADRLHPDRRRIDLIRRRPDHVGVPNALPYRVEISVALVLLHHADQPARGEGIGRDLRRPDLLLPGHDVHDGDRRAGAAS